jgi:3,4-dihydroxy 2-butanone 4-phosphate synthase / GTP cyclohydrolase II
VKRGREPHGTLIAVGTEALRTVGQRFTAHRFRSLVDGRPLLVSTPEPLLARIHSSCVTSEFLGGIDCDCAEQLEGALVAIAAAGRGVLFYLDQEGRGAGLVAKARDRMLVQASRHRMNTFDAYEQMGLERDLRRYDDVLFASRLLELRAPLRLLSNNPEKAESLARLGFDISTVESAGGSESPFNAHYLAAKSRAGHAMPVATPQSPAALPERVAAHEPRPVRGVPHLLRAASYLLPIQQRTDAGSPAWIRLHLHFDLRSGREIVAATTLGRARRRTRALLRVERERLVDRFPGAARGRGRWLRAASRLLAAPRGVALIRSGESSSQELSEVELRVLAALVPSRSITPLLDRARPTENERRALRSLSAAGFDVGRPAALGDAA